MPDTRLRPLQILIALCCGAIAISHAIHGESTAHAEEPPASLRDDERWLADGLFLVKVIQKELAEFGFLLRPFNGVLDERTRAGIRAFQFAAGLPATGSLDEGTYKKLHAFSEDLHVIVPILPRKSFFDYVYKKEECRGDPSWCFYIGASGSFAGDAHDIPHTVVIRCHGDRKECEYTSAIVGTSGKDLEINQATFKIARATRLEVVSERYPDGVCGYSVLRIDRQRKAVTLTRRSDSDAAYCKNRPDLDMRLVDGSEILKQRVDRNQRAWDFLNK